MKIGSGKPVVGATLVVARSRRHRHFHLLIWPPQGHSHSEEPSDEDATISPPPRERYRIYNLSSSEGEVQNLQSLPAGGEIQRGGSPQFNSPRLDICGDTGPARSRFGGNDGERCAFPLIRVTALARGGPSNFCEIGDIRRHFGNTFAVIAPTPTPHNLTITNRNATKCNVMQHFPPFFATVPSPSFPHTLTVIPAHPHRHSRAHTVIPAHPHRHCYENRLRQTCCRGNPCRCPFPAPHRSHPLIWPLQGHRHCYENRLRQTCCRGNPRGCPFPAPRLCYDR